MKIWQRHIFGQLAKTFFFLLSCLFAVYVIVDLSVHGVRFLSQSSGADVIRYYGYTFSTLLDLFLTLSFLLASMRLLFTLNAARELLALQMAGISKKRLLTPFFLFAGCLSLCCYINNQWVSPDAQDMTDAFKISNKPKKHKTEKVHVYSSVLEDGSELIYQRFDREKNMLFDVFWKRTPQDIWHMKTLQVDQNRGCYVHRLIRNGDRQLEKSESYETKEFPELVWNEAAALHRFVPFEHRPLSRLLAQGWTGSAERSSILSHLYYKLLVPLMPFFVLFAIAPISLQFSRSHPFFLITAGAIFGFIALKVVLDGMLILGENQVLSPIFAIWGPILLALGFSLPSFARMR